jgi:hypothetical protein
MKAKQYLFILYILFELWNYASRNLPLDQGESSHAGRPCSLFV